MTSKKIETIEEFWEEVEKCADAQRPSAANCYLPWHDVDKEWPAIGEKVILFANGVVQEDIYEFDQGDDGFGGGEHFWGRDDIDECPNESSRSPGCSTAGDLAREILPEVTAIMEELFSLYDDHESTLPQRVNSIRQRLIVEDVKSR